MMPILPDFSHIAAMTDRHGTFEHADHAAPRREHGYCTDDMARLLVVTAREQQLSGPVRDLARTALRFVAEAQGVDGGCRNRRSSNGHWRGPWSVEDCWGRSLWGLGVAATHGERWLAGDALACFEQSCHRRSPYRRSMAFAALGAAAVVTVEPRHRGALALLDAAADVVGARDAGMSDDMSDGMSDDDRWPWPEARLAYANAVVPEAMMAVGSALDRPALVDGGLELLGWLLDRETRHGHLSVTPAGGAGPHDSAPGFDQQPIEVAAMADACARALQLTGSERWADGVRMAAAWFDGDNDIGVAMCDRATGGGYDGLLASVANQNQGAESTLALISTRQQALLLASVPALVR